MIIAPTSFDSALLYSMILMVSSRHLCSSSRFSFSLAANGSFNLGSGASGQSIVGIEFVFTALSLQLKVATDYPWEPFSNPKTDRLSLERLWADA